MKSDVIVMASPGFDDGDRLRASSKPFGIETFIAKSTIEALVRSVLPWLPRRNVGRIDAGSGQLTKDGARYELGTVVGT
jgi:hypothetical protein